MDKLLNLVLILLLCLFVSRLNSQTTGFLGKRKTIEINSGMSFLSGNDKIFPSISGRDMTFNIHPEIAIGYTLGKRYDIGMKIGYNPGEIELPHQVEFKAFEYSYVEFAELIGHDFDNLSNYFLLAERTQKTRSYTVQAFVRQYLKDYLAPLGVYHQLSIGYNQVSFNTDVKGYFTSFNLDEEQYDHFIANEFYNTSTLKLDDLKAIEISYFIGNKKSFGKDYYLNMGIELNLMYNLSYQQDKIEEKDNSFQYHQHLLTILSKHILNEQLLEFKIGFGKIF